MKITRLEHAAFLVDAGGRRIVVDPGDFTAPGTLRALDRLDGVVVSHGHEDHFSLTNIEAAAVPVAAPSDVMPRVPGGLQGPVLRLGERAEVCGFGITPTPADHGPRLSRPIENYGLVIQHGDLRIYYVGDMAVASPPTAGPFDLVLVSIDADGFVFNPEQAAAFVEALGHNGPVVPIHDGDPAEPGCAERFADLAAGCCRPVLLKVGDSLEVGA